MDLRFSRFTAGIIAFVTVVFFLASCNEHTLISTKVSPANDTVGITSDTLSVITHTYYDNDIFTSSALSGINIYQAVGSVDDPFFGTIQGATFFQVANGYPGATFDSLIVDSAVLVLPYSGLTYGDTTDHTITETFQVFYISDTMNYYTPYYPTSTKALDIAAPLSNPTTVNLNHMRDSIYVTGVNTPGLRIKLNKDRLLARLNPALHTSATATDPSTAFVSAFNGVCVRQADTRNINKTMCYFRLSGSDAYTEAGILVYCREAASDTEQIWQFYHNSSGGAGACGHFNNIVRTYSKSPINNLLHSTQANDSIVAITNKPGPNIDIKIYGINSIPKNVVINKAELELSILPQYNASNFSSLEQIFPVGIGNGTYPMGISQGLEYIILDRQPITSTTPYTVLDGTSHVFPYCANGINTFTLGVPREVMACIASQTDTLHLHINGSQDYYAGFRMVVGGGSYPDKNYRARLKVVYSTLKK